ncbi:MAG TPA: permease-like cell division protein FtsX [Gammaproteobacteria bacterium]|nr:permease-like cell division protein FtsX [Gammaproteobacteria bacterium]
MSRAVDTRAALPGARLGGWLRHHAMVAAATLARFRDQPLATLMTAGVIGIALALPAGLHAAIANVRALAGTWEQTARITAFMKRDVTLERTRALGHALAERPEIAAVDVIAAEEALAEFRRLSGFGTALDLLDGNPLPHVLVIRLADALGDPGRATALANELRRRPDVDLVQLDTDWLARLDALLALGERAALLLAVLFAVAVLLVVGNTIRLEIQQRRDEIEIVKLLGASDGFVRRPFLYDGLGYGILGGLTALLIVWLAGVTLAGPVERLAGLYGGTFTLQGLDAPTAALVLATAAALGWLGAWLAVSRHLDAIEPR